MAYEIALNLAWDNLSRLDLKEVAGRSEGDLKDNRLTVDFLKEKFIVDPAKHQVFFNKLEIKAKDFIAVLILHYLIGVKDLPLAGEKISFKDLPGGDFYFPAFRQSCLMPLINGFSNRPQALAEQAKYLNGEVVSLGDNAVEVKPFGRLPLTVVVWGKDSEFSAEANVLYDATAKEFLPTEDIVVVTNLTVAKLVSKHGIVSLKK